MLTTQKLMDKIRQLQSENMELENSVDFLAGHIASVSEQGYEVSKRYWKLFARTRDHEKSVAGALGDKAADKQRMQPCPYCGSNVLGIRVNCPGSHLVGVSCGLCDMMGPIAKTADDAMAKWNALAARVKEKDDVER